VLVRHAGDVLERLQHAGGRLAVNHGHQPGRRAAQLGGQRVGLDHAAPLGAHRHHVGAATRGDLDEQESEATALADDHAVAGLDDRRDGGLEAGPAGS